jgi:hypothetical protein
MSTLSSVSMESRLKLEFSKKPGGTPYGMKHSLLRDNK